MLPSGSMMTKSVTKTSPKVVGSKTRLHHAEHRHAGRLRDDLRERGLGRGLGAERARSCSRRGSRSTRWSAGPARAARPRRRARASSSWSTWSTSSPREPRRGHRPDDVVAPRSGPRLLAAGCAKTATPPAPTTMPHRLDDVELDLATWKRPPVPIQSGVKASPTVATGPASTSACATCGRPTVPPGELLHALPGHAGAGLLEPPGHASRPARRARSRSRCRAAAKTGSAGSNR